MVTDSIVERGSGERSVIASDGGTGRRGERQLGAFFILNQSSNWEGNTSTPLTLSRQVERTFTRGATAKVATGRCIVAHNTPARWGNPFRGNRSSLPSDGKGNRQPKEFIKQ